LHYAMDKMLTIGVKKGVFSYEELFELLYGRIQNGVWLSKPNFKEIPISYRKELIKKMASSDILKEASKAFFSGNVQMREINTDNQWVDLLEEIALWIGWGVSLDLGLSEVRKGILDNIDYVACCAPYTGAAAQLLEAFGMPHSKAKAEIAEAVYYAM